jgi:hypothetical protein
VQVPWCPPRTRASACPCSSAPATTTAPTTHSAHRRRSASARSQTRDPTAKVSVLFSVVFTGSQTRDPTAKVSVTTNTGSMYFVFCRLYLEPNQGPNCESKCFVFCRLYPEPNQGPNCESKCYNQYRTNVFCFLSSIPGAKPGTQLRT